MRYFNSPGSFHNSLKTAPMRFWEVLYPVFMYYAVTVAALYVLHFLLPGETDVPVFRQLLTSLASLPVLYSFYRQGKPFRAAMQPKRTVLVSLLAFVSGVFFALALNNLLGMLRIADYSASYEQVSETFYSGRVALELLALGVVIPVTEEFLFRGIVYERAKNWLGPKRAALVSAVLFGVVHMNLVQFVYAFIFGILLAYFMERSGSFAAAAAAHMAANISSVLRAETNILPVFNQNSIVTTAVLFLAAAAGIFGTEQLCKKFKK